MTIFDILHVPASEVRLGDLLGKGNTPDEVNEIYTYRYWRTGELVTRLQTIYGKFRHLAATAIVTVRRKSVHQLLNPTA